MQIEPAGEHAADAEETIHHPRWWFFGLFAVLAAIHLAGGWTSTTVIGLSVGFAATLVLVFVRRLPGWLTGEREPRRARPAAALPVSLLGLTAVVAGIVDHPPHGADVIYAVFVLACALGLVVFVVARRAPVHLSRAGLSRRLRLRTLALATVVVAGVALEIAAFATFAGALPWVLPGPVLLAVAAVARWRAHVAGPARLLAAGPWTEVAAATLEDIRPAGPAWGWARLPTGIRASFRITNCPPDVAAELLHRRRLWIAGEPREGEVAVGIPGGDSFATAVFAVRDRKHRRARARQSSSLPG